MILKTFVARSPNGEQLLRFLPPLLSEEVKGASSSPAVDFGSLFSPTKWIPTLHYSWFIPPLEKIPQEAQQLFVSLLPPSQGKKVAEKLGIDYHPSPLSPFSKRFLGFTLRNILEEEALLPVPCLPPSDFKILLKMSKKNLLYLIDLLGIHDLAADLRHIVDRELLDKVYAVLSKNELHFLYYCIKQPIKWVPPKLGVTRWSGSSTQLHHLLHQRGLARLARGLSKEHPSFIWHFLHRLDMGRAKIMKKTLQEDPLPSLTSYFAQQILHILKRRIP